MESQSRQEKIQNFYNKILDLFPKTLQNSQEFQNQLKRMIDEFESEVFMDGKEEALEWASEMEALSL